MSIFSRVTEASSNWESFLGLWQRANFVRAFFWNQRFADEKVLLTHFLARMRRFFAVDFCYGGLLAQDQCVVEVGQPEAGLRQLPDNFFYRCMDLIANSRDAVTWHSDVSARFGYFSTILVPLRPPGGRSFGFMMLGHGRRKSYSPHERFLLQALAAELGWVLRELTARKRRQGGTDASFHDVKNALEVIDENAALIRQKLKRARQGDCEEYLKAIESSAQQIADRLNVPAEPSKFANEDSGPWDSLADTGGDVYLKSRLGRAEEFIVRLPLQGSAASGRLKI